MTYRGSRKHKNRPTGEMKGTLCPEWTHVTPAGSFGTDEFRHDWPSTEAARLFASAIDHSGCRYATCNGIAFEAKDSADGSWHGFPVSWEDVPPPLLELLLDTGSVTRRQVKRHFSFDRADIFWAWGASVE